jgi:hypothetical protein
MDRGPVKVLTDTHTLVWALTGQPLGASARKDAEGRAAFRGSSSRIWGSFDDPLKISTHKLTHRHLQILTLRNLGT